MKERLEQLNLSIEIAKETDWEALRDIRVDALKTNPEAFGATLKQALARTDDDWRSQLSRYETDKFFVVAKADQTITGIKSLAAANLKEAPDNWHITGVYTRPEFRGRGLSKKIMQQILKEVAARGGKKITLNVTLLPDQQPARDLYKQLGFNEVETVHEDGEDHWKMLLELKDDEVVLNPDTTSHER